MIKTITISHKYCIACGLCQIHAPKIFDYHANGIVKLITTSARQLNITKEDFKSIIIASNQCPTHAISMQFLDNEMKNKFEHSFTLICS
ncbi:MAG: ferredoxin [Lactobacillales bacterium]|jgi:ferredoxin|nr:ferredoxin [Lactobacillales bacterium]